MVVLIPPVLLKCQVTEIKAGTGSRAKKMAPYGKELKGRGEFFFLLFNTEGAMTGALAALAPYKRNLGFSYSSRWWIKAEL